jgi:hypothetical protein
MADGAEETKGQFIEVRLDLAAEVPRDYTQIGLDEDGPSYHEEPTTILDQVVAAAAAQLIGVKERDLRKAIVKQVENQVGSFVRSQMPAILKEALNGRLVIPATSDYGQDTVVPSLRDMITTQAQQQLRKTSDRYGSDKPVLQQLVSETVKQMLGEDLRAELEAARKVLRDEIAQRAQQLLAKAVEEDLKAVSGSDDDVPF